MCRRRAEQHLDRLRHPALLQYSGSRVPSINREWIEIFALSANSVQGLQFTEEPSAVTQSPRSRVGH